MDKYIKIYDDVIDVDSCNMLIGKFEAAEEDQYEEVRQAERDKAIAFTQINLGNNDDWTSVQNGMLEVFQDYIMAYIHDCNIQPKQWPTTYGYEAIRMKRYLNNNYDRFDPHVDVLNRETSRRFLAFFIYLNDVDEGGETEFIQLTKPGTHIPLKIKPQRGRLLMFPPQWMYYHAGLKPVSNNKYLIHSYCHYD